MALIAVMTAARLSVALVVIVAVAMPLMVMVPVRRHVVIAAPAKVFAFALADTPVCAEIALIAAALAIALRETADYSGRRGIGRSNDAPIAMPLILKSLAAKAVCDTCGRRSVRGLGGVRCLQ